MNWLCWLGFHRWERHRTALPECIPMRICARCGLVKNLAGQKRRADNKSLQQKEQSDGL